ncbi:hypothetical protein [Azospirillum halopraeferens]|uniref:hypothetical protein n=1 Tax=Azospirillum halopraeferens TaxID=34010 RepID=UPI0003FCBB23|nr:hypothetical protein [Azospirillum halopraeferens]
MTELQERVVAGLTARLLSPEAVALFIKTYAEERRRLRTEARREHAEVEARLAKLTRQISNIIDAIADGAARPSMRTKLMELEAEGRGRT